MSRELPKLLFFSNATNKSSRSFYQSVETRDGEEKKYPEIPVNCVCISNVIRDQERKIAQRSWSMEMKKKVGILIWGSMGFEGELGDETYPCLFSWRPIPETWQVLETFMLWTIFISSGHILKLWTAWKYFEWFLTLWEILKRFLKAF